MINFPNDPVINQIYFAANKNWQWDGTAWKALHDKPIDISEPPDWIRPADWLELDIPEDTEERFTALVAVYDREENYCAFTAEGNYTVDWGDGTVEDYASGDIAYHQYDFDNIELDGTLTSEGFKQAILTITPQEGNSLTLLDFGVEYPNVGVFLSGFKDLAFSAPNLEVFSFANESDPYNELLGYNLYTQSNGAGTPFSEYFTATANQTEYTLTAPTDYSQITVRNNSTAFYISPYDYSVSNSGVITFAEGVLEEGIEYFVQSRAAGYIRDFEATIAQTSFDLNGEPIYLETLEVRNVTTNTLLVQGVDYTATPHAELVGFGTGEIILDVPATEGHIYRIIAEVPGSAQYYRIPRLHYYAGSSRLTNSFNDLEQIYIGFNKVKNWYYRFFRCQQLKNIARLEVFSAICTDSMFEGCNSLRKIKNLVVSEVESASKMFYECKSLTYAHFTEFNVCYSYSVFEYCRSLRYIKVDDFSKTIYAEYMFNKCVGLQYADLVDCGRLQTTYEMFYDAYSLITVNMTNLVSLKYAKWMFEECYGLEYVDLSSTSALLNSENMFEYNYSLKTVKIDISKVIAARYMFERCHKLVELDLDFSNAVELSGVIQRCRSLTSANFITSNRLRAIAYNYDASRLETFNISNLVNTAFYFYFDFGEGYGTDSMYSGCYLLKNFPESVPVSPGTFNQTPIADTAMADISRSINLQGAFYGCWNLKTITFTTEDLSPDLENIEAIFTACQSLQEIPALDFSETNVTNANYAFAECSSLVRSQVTGLGASHSYAYGKLSAAALNEIFTNLPTVFSKSIEVYGNPGVNQLEYDPTIATAKGWTVID
jgi:hypothetical protein